MKILITGASGFIGSFIVEEALKRGWDTWAAVRPTSSKKYLQDERIHFIHLDFSSLEALVEGLRGHQFDYVVHAAGVTKTANPDDFYRVNTLGTKHLVDALTALQMPLRKFVYLSSLSVMGALREQQPYTEILDSDTPQPNTAYGRSKLEAEKYLVQSAECRVHSSQFRVQSALSNNYRTPDTMNSELCTLNYIILRPTGVYGPREKDYFLMFKSIRGRVDFSVGYTPQDITFIYVSDVVQAVFRALESAVSGRAYFLSDGQVYRSEDFSRLIQQQMSIRRVLRIKCPIALLRLITTIGDFIGRKTGRPSALNRDKFHILRQRNWRCDIAPAQRDLGFSPQVQLAEGVRRTYQWYIENGWIE